MDLNRVEWAKAQDLLLKLVQVLSPLVDRSESASLFLMKRFFIPPSLGSDSSSFRFRHPVRLLTTLHSVQKQVEEFIGKPSSPSAESRLDPLPKGQPSAAKENEAQCGEVASKPSDDMQQKPSNPPLIKQAQKLIDQVQEAIGKLCYSNNLKDPQEGPLREVLKRLKPNLDRIIEFVAQEEMHHSDQQHSSTYRFALPRSGREHLIQKLIPFPNAERTPLNPERRTLQPSEGQKPPKSDVEAPFLSQKSNPPVQQPKTPVPPYLESKKPFSRQDQEGSEVRPPDRVSLPGAPFIPLTRNLSPTKKKKKRKGFWFREEEEEQSKS